MKKSLLVVSVTMVAMVIVYLVWEREQAEISPCEGIFQQTTVSLTSKLEIPGVRGGLSIGREQIQELTERSQQIALNLKTCCILRHEANISSEEFLSCKGGVENVETQFEKIVTYIREANVAERQGQTKLVKDKVRQINRIRNDINKSSQEFNQLVIHLKHTGDFTYERARETAEHVHYAVVFEKGHGEEAVGHLPVLIIRARGDYKDIPTRAKYVAEHLNTALDFLEKGAGLGIVQEGSDSSIFVMPPGQRPIRVLRVHSGDTIGELQRCNRQVDSHLLARYWKAWLEDFIELFVRHRKPLNLIETHTGLVLKLIYTQAKTLGDGVVDEQSVHEAVDLLPHSHWDRLDDLAGCVVGEFE